MLKQINLFAVWAAMVVAVLVGGMAAGATPAQALTSAQIQQSLLSSVQILIANADKQEIGICSGSVVDPTGLILTNYHCVGFTNIGGSQEPAIPGWTQGKLYNPDGLVAISPTVDPRKIPVPTYWAQYVVGSDDLDIAVLRIVGMLDPNQTLPADLPLSPIPLGDSSKVLVGDPTYLFGYPAAGGALITFTEGHISGFDATFRLHPDGTVNAFKTDATMSGGSSGGFATNDKGEQIGITEYGKGGGNISGVRFVNLAVPYIQQASNTTPAAPVVPKPASPLPAPGAAPAQPGTGAASFQPLSFGAGLDSNNQITGASATFPSGIKTVYAQFAYSGMTDGTPWGRSWILNGQPVGGKPNGYSWKDGASGTEALSIGNDQGLGDGPWELALFINNKEVERGKFTVGQGAPSVPPKPKAPAPAKNSVGLRGQIVDAATQNGIPNAVVVLLKPGLKLADLQSPKASNDMVAAQATTGRDGSFQTAPPVASGNTYTMVVLADGYQGRAFDGGLTVPSDASGSLTLDPIALASQ